MLVEWWRFSGSSKPWNKKPAESLEFSPNHHPNLTLRKTNMEPKNPPIEKEHHSHSWGSILIFSRV